MSLLILSAVFYSLNHTLMKRHSDFPRTTYSHDTVLPVPVYIVEFCAPGVLLHYDDVNLANIYFLDPQWLCDVLANVVTIREINSLAKCGM